ncbi:MAG: hypothetical protein K1X94_02635 [Sandaracinaceae bacterium]|nr:hypothetical protein [Sandaracinaceae bacterium]
MSDEKDKRAATVPGFGLKAQPLPPLQVDAMQAVDDELTTVDPGGRVEVVDANVPMKLEAQPVAAPAPLPPLADRQPAAPTPDVQRTRRSNVPAVDIDLVYERRSAPLPDQPWVFLEIWTRNTIYALDARLVCIDVVDQLTKRSHGDHPLRGARLVGGQAREGDAMELSHPFPRPGAEAVFEQMQGRHVRFSQTSTVTRVVMRLRVLTVTPEQLLPTWEEVTGSHKIKP